MLAPARVVERIEQGKPLHSEMLRHRVSARRLHVDCGKTVLEPAFDVIHPFREKSARGVDRAYAARVWNEPRQATSLQEFRAGRHPLAVGLVMLGRAFAAIRP